MDRRIEGSIEIVIAEESRGVPVLAVTPALVPAVVEALYGVTDLVPAATGERGELHWTGRDATGAAAEVRLWPEPPAAGPAAVQTDADASDRPR